MYRYIFVIGQVEFIGSNMGKHVWDISSMGIYVVPPYHIVSAVEPTVESPFLRLGGHI